MKMKQINMVCMVMMVAGFARAEIICSNDFTGTSGESPVKSSGADPGLGSVVMRTQLDGAGHLIPAGTNAANYYQVTLGSTPLKIQEEI
jgi:hypothetical protein